MPTSITVAPGLIQSPLTISARPTAATRMSASRQMPGRSLEREWAMVTVQSAASSSWAIGLPIRFERPITTARLPDRSPTTSLSSTMQPAGVHEVRAGRPLARRPALVTVRPSTSLSGEIAATIDALTRVVGHRELHQDPVDGRIVVEALDQRQQLGLRGLGRQAVGLGMHARGGGLLALAADIDLAGGVLADQHHGQARRQAVLGLQGRDLGGDLLAKLGREGLAVDDSRLATWASPVGAWVAPRPSTRNMCGRASEVA